MVLQCECVAYLYYTHSLATTKILDQKTYECYSAIVITMTLTHNSMRLQLQVFLHLRM